MLSRLTVAVLSVVALAPVSPLLALAADRPGVPPETLWACPATHPIKAYVSEQSERRVYYVPWNRFYEEVSPERCYASEDEARQDGCRPARDPQPSPSSQDLVRQGAPRAGDT